MSARYLWGLYQPTLLCTIKSELLRLLSKYTMLLFYVLKQSL